MKPRYAIVCVHGIGRQAQGQTTREVATAVRRGAEALGGSVADAEKAAAAEPGMRTLDVHLPKTTPFELALYDGRWDHLVEPPPWRTVLLWMLRVAPFAIWLTMAGWVNDIFYIQERRGRTSDVLHILPAGAVLLVPLIAPVLMVLALCATPVVLLNKRFAAAARTIVSSWVGDAWMYRSDRLDETAIASVRGLVERVSQTSDSVILLGHSQGAEISRRVALDTDVSACIWVGSGEFPLATLRMLRRSPGMVVALWAVLLTFPLLFSVVTTALWEGLVSLVTTVVSAFDGMWPPPLVEPHELDDRLGSVSGGFMDFAWSGVGEMVFALAYFIVAVGIIVRLKKTPSDQLKRPSCEVTVVKSLLDPVCLGPRDDTEFIRYVPVSKPRKWWREHVAYFEKPRTGVAMLEVVVGPAAIARDPYLPTLGVGINVLGAGAVFVMTYVLWALGTWMLSLLPF